MQSLACPTRMRGNRLRAVGAKLRPRSGSCQALVLVEPQCVKHRLFSFECPANTHGPPPAQDPCLSLAFDYAEHDLYEMLRYHRDKLHAPMDAATVKSVMWQLLNGLSYMEQNWLIHRDLKPSNILVMGDGEEQARLLRPAGNLTQTHTVWRCHAACAPTCI